MSEDGDASRLTRRGLLGATVGAGAVAGATGRAAAAPVTVDVGPGGRFVFEPGTVEPLRIRPGTTVRFVWRSDNHNVVVDDEPAGADWAGHETLETAGFSFEHSFETPGTYEFYCRPHRSMGMTGTIVVGEESGAQTGAGPERPVAGGPMMLALSTVGGIAVILGLGYLMLRYGGGPVEPDE